MRKKTHCLVARSCAIFFLFLVSTSLLAQKKVSGTVTSSKDKQPLGFVTVTVKGTNISTATSSSGQFSIVVPAGRKTLLFTSVGFDDLEADANSDNLSVSLKERTSSLDEVVVTGYTAQKKKDLTSAVGVVNIGNMKEIPAGNPENMLQGQTPGITVVTSGSPGGFSDLKIRGITSLGNVTPLIIVDGMESINGMHDLNVNDIESMQVLKDAAASIYGVRGSNGVIVITTKRGKAGKPKISYDAYYGVQEPVSGFKLANAQQYADVLYDQNYNSGANIAAGSPLANYFGAGDTVNRQTPVIPAYIHYSTAAQGYIGDSGPGTLPYDINNNQITKVSPGNNWYKDIFKPAPIESHNLSVSGGGDKSSYLFSFGYMNQQGTLINTYLKRYSVRANTLFNVADHIRVGENLTVFFKDNPTILNQNEGNAISYSYREPPLLPTYDVMGNYAGTKVFTTNNSANPVATQQRMASNKGNDWQIVGNAFAEVDLLKHFTLRTTVGGTIENFYLWYFTYTAYENAEGNTTANSFTEESGYNSHYQWTNTLTYSNQFGDHNIRILAGTESHEYYTRYMGGSRSNYVVTDPTNETVDPNTWTLSNGSPGGQTNSSYANWSSLYSQFGQLNYSFKDKYLLDGIVRRDGSSLFAPGHQYNVFPSVTGAWRISREDFFKNVTFINDLKIRGGWGVMGALSNVPTTNQFNIYNQAPGNSYYDINGTSNSSVLGFYSGQQGNQNGTWEKDKNTDVGLDATMINNRLEFTFDWYNKAISGLLFPASEYYVFYNGTEPYVNLGNVTNKGVEFTLTYHGNASRDFRYDIGINASHYTNEITALPAPGYQDELSYGSTRISNFERNEVGHPIGAFYGYQVVGLFQSWADVAKSPAQASAAPGRFKYADASGDATISPNDRVFFGNPNPKLTYGINIRLSYKNFDFSTFLYGVYGNDVLNYTKYWTDFPQVFEGDVRSALLTQSAVLVNSSGALTTVNDPTATVKNPGAKIPVIESQANFSNSTVVNSYYDEKGSYLRMKSLIIGYTIAPAALHRVGIDRLRIYVQGANLFTITKYSGLDPELQTSTYNSSNPATGNTATTNSSFGVDFGNYPSNQKNFNVGVNVTF